MDSKNIIKGRNLMLFSSEGTSYGFATNHTLSITADTSDISSKDHGIWGASEVSKISWEISTENLYTEKEYDKLFEAMILGEPIELRFGIKAEADDGKTVVDGDYDNWTAGSTYYNGKAYITSLEANAQNGENATFSATFSGCSKLAKVSA